MKNYSSKKWREGVLKDGVKPFNYHNIKKADLCKTGVTFLDEALMMTPNSFTLIGAGTGVGKTQLGYNICYRNASQGRKVLGIFLEAYEGEMFDRRKFSLFSEKFFSDPERKKGLYDIRFNKWRYGFLDQAFQKYEDEVLEELKKDPENLVIISKTKVFDVDTLEKIKDVAVRDKADLIVIDHIHYFDYDQQQESKALSLIISQLENIANHNSIPIVLFAQFRKEYGAQKKKFRSIDDFHGTANLTRVPTDIVILTREFFDEETLSSYTCFEIPKSRFDSVKDVACQVRYSLKSQWYANDYVLGKIINDKFVPDTKSKPVWATSASNNVKVREG